MPRTLFEIASIKKVKEDDCYENVGEDMNVFILSIFKILRTLK